MNDDNTMTEYLKRVQNCKCPKEKRYCVDHPARADSCYVCVDMMCIDCGKQSKATFSIERIKD